MLRNFVPTIVLASVVALPLGCSGDEPAKSSGGGGSGGAGGGAATGGSAGASGANGGVSGTSNGGTAGTSSGGTTSGASGSSGTSGSGGSPSGGASGDAGASGSAGSMAGVGMTGGAGSGGGGTGAGGAASGGKGGAGGAANAMMNFFVTSDTSTTGNLGGLMMADMRCQTLAAAVGHGNKMWRAYLSVANPMTHAINRIGEGPYYNSAGAMVAADKTALHARSGDAALFIDERGNRVNGQWMGSPTPNQHDVLTGSQENGMLSTGNTCSDWTATTGNAQVGHSDGLGPGMSSADPYNIWNGAHTAPCGNLAQTGGAGKLYCFVAPP